MFKQIQQIQDQDHKKALLTALKAAKEGRKILEHHYGHITQIEEKEYASLVSIADRESEKKIISVLRNDFPNVNVLGEEGGYSTPSSSDSMWIIDPLDGTTNYLHQYPFYCISIGLKVGNNITVGVVEVPLLNKTYWGVTGFGAFCDDSKLQVRKVEKFKDTLLATGFFASAKVNLEHQVQVFKKCVEIVRGVRRCGSAALELCFTAEGILDGYWEYGLSPWDTAAGILLIKEAGGIVSNEIGKPFDLLKDNGVVVGNAIAHKNILEIIKSQTK